MGSDQDRSTFLPANRFFSTAPLTDVPSESAKDIAMCGWRCPDGELDREFMAVAVEALHLQACVENGPFTSFEKALETQAMSLPMALGNDGIRHQSAHCLGF